VGEDVNTLDAVCIPQRSEATQTAGVVKAGNPMALTNSNALVTR
jgi:hypothetical protein